MMSADTCTGPRSHLGILTGNHKSGSAIFKCNFPGYKAANRFHGFPIAANTAAWVRTTYFTTLNLATNFATITGLFEQYRILQVSYYCYINELAGTSINLEIVEDPVGNIVSKESGTLTQTQFDTMAPIHTFLSKNSEKGYIKVVQEKLGCRTALTDASNDVRDASRAGIKYNPWLSTTDAQMPHYGLALQWRQANVTAEDAGVETAFCLVRLQFLVEARGMASR